MLILAWKDIATRTGRTGRLIGIVSACVLATSAWADSLPAGVRACSAQTDSDKRLACYDREVAPFLVPATPANANVLPSTTQRPQPTAHDAQQGALTGGSVQEPGHLSVRVERIEYSADDIIVHLDNGQIWESVPDSSRIWLRKGDAVDLDLKWGSWWLSARHIPAIQVRQQK
jgi:hypothetical protein